MCRSQGGRPKQHKEMTMSVDDAEWGDCGRERTVLFGALLAVLASAALAVGMVWVLVTVTQ